MAESSRPAKVWMMRATFVALAFALIFYHLLPLDLMPASYAGPDVLTALCFAWALRRPDYVPALLVAAVMLLGDLLFQRPPGLWALLVLMATEFLKSRDRPRRETTFLQEWIAVAVVLAVITILFRLALALLIVPEGTSFLALMRYAMTVICYPLIVLLSQGLFGVRRMAPGDFDHAGRPM
ncbi:rod shape-determining protein MreD [Salipiger sp. CCB-MM3]|uniref:rod shape-determining protein MreD n=1 Tax=Salipiger sp. CCB-MM3 TaxID=1792508 RepID=UPI00080A96FB|nr:rod shape-determining protein MreD [Salipiger sp. CCB-MM3]ANT59669.1 rod shape-determining protein MreD [Salipiger sp. CCB-MM3]